MLTDPGFWVPHTYTIALVVRIEQIPSAIKCRHCVARWSRHRGVVGGSQGRSPHREAKYDRPYLILGLGLSVGVDLVLDISGRDEEGVQTFKMDPKWMK